MDKGLGRHEGHLFGLNIKITQLRNYDFIQNWPYVDMKTEIFWKLWCTYLHRILLFLQLFITGRTNK